MGVVYRAAHTTLGRPAALKMLLPQFSADDVIVQRFINEAKAASAIRHPGIVEIYDVGTHSDASVYIVMALLPGQSLEAKLRGRALPLHEALNIAQQVAGALAAAHDTGIVHRDLKPDNIFLVPDEDMPGGVRVKLLDFGIAKLVGGNNVAMTQSGMMMGTPLYMSPEQCRGAADVDHRTDLYALGCVLYHMVCGRTPFTGDSVGMIIAAHLRDEPVPPSRLEPGIPRELEQIISSLLHKEREGRLQRASAVRTALKQLAGMSSSQPPMIAPSTPPAAHAATVASYPPSAPPGIARVHPTTVSSSVGQVLAASPARGRWKAYVAGGVVIVGAAATAGFFALHDPAATVTPLEVKPAVTAGALHSCVLRANGEVTCWGDPELERTRPRTEKLVAISGGGFHACGLRRDRTAVCWGIDHEGSTQFAGAYRQISAGGYHTCALSEAGTLQCRGSNEHGQSTPPSGSFVTVNAGVYETCAVHADGRLACWGKRSSPELPAGTFTSVAVGLGFGCAITRNRDLSCWGANGGGQATPPTGAFTLVGAGEYHACALRTDRTVTCWGLNANGRASPPDGAFVDLAVGAKHACALRDNGNVECWGDDGKGQAPRELRAPR